MAEKRAAIAAVLDRLARVGLADLVLDLHEGAGSRRALAEKLAVGLRAAGSVARPDQVELHERLVTRRDRLNAHDSAMHRRRAPWDVSVFEAQCELIGLLERHGAAVESEMRIRGGELAALDGAAMRRVARELYEFASLGGLTLTRRDSLWADAHVVSAEQAQAALQAATRLASATAPDTRRVLDEVVAQTGLAEPRTLGEWTGALSLLDRVSTLFTRLRPEIFAASLAEMVAAAAPRAWRKQRPDWPGVSAGWLERRRTRKAAKQLWCGTSKPSKPELRDTLAEAHDIVVQWRVHAVDGGPPRLPATLLDVHGRFEQLTREVAALGAYLSGTDFASLPTSDLEPALRSLTRDERTLRTMPRINELTAGFGRAGLGPLVSDLRTRRVDATLAAATFELCWYRSILEKAGFDDQVIANFTATVQDTTVETFREADTQHIRQAAQRVRRAAAERLVRTHDDWDEQSALVQAQAARKRGHLPLRQLFSAART